MKGGIMHIWFWGAGKYSERIMNVIIDKKMITGIIDKSKAIHGTIKNGVLVYAPETVVISQADIVIITAFYQYEEIYLEAVQHLKIEPDKILCFFDERANYKVWEDYIDRYKWEMIYQNIMMSRRLEILEQEMACIKNLKYEILDMYNKSKISFPCIRSGEEVLYRMIAEHKSMCRFGDGEFEMIAGRKRPDFQLPDEQLGNRLREVLEREDARVLLCIADNYGSLEAYTENAANGIRMYMTEEIRQEHMELLDPNREYYDTYVSRPYIIYKDKKKAKTLFILWKKVWENRDVLIVEGCLTRNGYKNDLFANAKSVKRLLAPAENAWKCYREMLQYIVEKVAKETLVVISLGPTATVLAYDLAISGYQAIDIGHIDNEYEWYLLKAEERVNISYKCVYEVMNGRMVEDIHDADFDGQVIARIGC